MLQPSIQRHPLARAIRNRIFKTDILVKINFLRRRWIFRDTVDRGSFIERLDRVNLETQNTLLCLGANSQSFHLLLKTAQVPIAKVMRRLLTGHAIFYNRRHRRYGHLFQNRYKSILCQEDTYLLQLVRHIHLNPLRFGLVSSLETLDRSVYSGHSPIMGDRTATKKGQPLYEDLKQKVRAAAYAHADGYAA